MLGIHSALETEFQCEHESRNRSYSDMRQDGDTQAACDKQGTHRVEGREGDCFLRTLSARLSVAPASISFRAESALEAKWSAAWPCCRCMACAREGVHSHAEHGTVLKCEGARVGVGLQCVHRCAHVCECGVVSSALERVRRSGWSEGEGGWDGWQVGCWVDWRGFFATCSSACSNTSNNACDNGYRTKLTMSTGAPPCEKLRDRVHVGPLRSFS
jgi:hypothetical protein